MRLVHQMSSKAARAGLEKRIFDYKAYTPMALMTEEEESKDDDEIDAALPLMNAAEI